MISHLRIAACTPGYRPPVHLNGATKPTPQDRTTNLQLSLKNRITAPTPGPPNNHYVTGDMPSHVGGRGHLEGTCVAQPEGLLQTKKQRRKKGEKGEKDDLGNEWPEDDSDDEEEESKVWKPTGVISQSKETANPFSSSQILPQAKKKSAADGATNPNSAKVGGASTMGNIEADLQSLNRTGLDWKKSTKMGKKSNANFETWLDDIAKVMHDQQVSSEDSVFTTM